MKLPAQKARLKAGLAGLLLLAMLAVTIGPMAAAGAAQSRLPMCCRRAGTHHCAGDTRTQGIPGFSATARCGAWPEAVVAAHTPLVAARFGGARFAGLLPSVTLVGSDSPASPAERTEQQTPRGPPANS